MERRTFGVHIKGHCYLLPLVLKFIKINCNLILKMKIVWAIKTRREQLAANERVLAFHCKISFLYFTTM